MHLLICDLCLNSDMLCAGCQKNRDSGAIKDFDVDLSRTIHRLSEKNHTLSGVKLSKVIDGNSFIVLLAGKGDGAKLVGKKGAVVKELAKKYGKSIKVLEEGDFKNFVSNLIAPSTVLGTNIRYTQSGEKRIVRVSSGQSGKSPVSNEFFSSVVKDVFNLDAELAVE